MQQLPQGPVSCKDTHSSDSPQSLPLSPVPPRRGLVPVPAARGDFFPPRSWMEIERGLQGRSWLESPGQGTSCLQALLFTSASEVNSWSKGAVRSLVECLRFCFMSDTLPPFLWVQFLHGMVFISGHLIYPQVTPCPERLASSPKTLLLIFLIPPLSRPLSLLQLGSAPSPVLSASLLPIACTHQCSHPQQAAKLGIP